MTLSKPQKAIVLLSAAWGIASLLFSAVISDSTEKHFNVVSFITFGTIFLIPVFIYWGGVWIWGFGYILKTINFILRLPATKLAKEFYKFVFWNAVFCGVVAIIYAYLGIAITLDVMLSIAIASISLLIPVWIYLDATKHKIGQTGKRSWSNRPAGEIAALYGLLSILAVPIWLSVRKKLIEKAQVTPVEVSKKRRITSVTLLICLPILYGWFNAQQSREREEWISKTANDRMTQALTLMKNNPDFIACNERMKKGEFKTNAEYVTCKNPILAVSLMKAGVKHTETSNAIIAKNLEIAEKADAQNYTDEQMKQSYQEIGNFMYQELVNDIKSQ